MATPFETGAFGEPGRGGSQDPKNLNNGQTAEHRVDGDGEQHRDQTVADTHPRPQSQFGSRGQGQRFVSVSVTCL